LPLSSQGEIDEKMTTKQPFSEKTTETIQIKSLRNGDTKLKTPNRETRQFVEDRRVNSEADRDTEGLPLF
jgi:hypothetical protein